MIEKIKIFEKYLNKIETKSIREFTEFVLLNAPDYFWTLPASTIQINHGANETLIDHILGCLAIGEEVCEGQFKNHWTRKQKDLLYSALMLHDCWRCGEPGKEERITQKLINKLELDQALLGNLKTSFNHAEIGYKQILILAEKFNDVDTYIEPDDVDTIALAVKYHYGPFGTNKDLFDLGGNYDSVIIQTHNIDFHQTKNMKHLTRG